MPAKYQDWSAKSYGMGIPDRTYLQGIRTGLQDLTGMEHQIVHAYEVSSIKVGLQDLTGKAHQIEPAYKVADRGCRISRVGNYRSYMPTRYQEVTSGFHGFETPDRTRL